MPPASNVRKAPAPQQESTAHAQNARRSQSGRAIRTNTTRPANYYARPFGSLSAQSATTANEAEQDASPGFYPAITYFTDAISALPKEAIRHFTLLKEVEAKIHAPGQRLDELVEALLEREVPRRRHLQPDVVTAAGRGLLGFGASGSTSGSLNPSVVNGVTPNLTASQLSAQNSVAGSLNGDGSLHDIDEDLTKRKQYHEMRLLTHQLLANLDEKNTVLAQTNELLASQLMRLDDVWPHVEAEIPEEARLGSMTHWAYGDNRIKRAQPVVHEKSRRDVAATNSLAAAASAMHEIDIATARQQAGREANKEKQKGRLGRENVDSDLDDKTRRANTKGAKTRAVAVTGLGISHGEPVKRRKVEKLTAPAMERSGSSKSKAARETPRSTPAVEPPAKRAAPKPKPTAPPAKKRGPTSAANSPALASSPLHSSFNPRTMEPPVSTPRVTTTRRRQNSSTNLRHEKSVDTSRPSSSAGKTNGNNKRKAPHDTTEPQPEPEPVPPEPDQVLATSEKAPAADTFKKQDDSSGRNTGSPRPQPSRGNSGRNSKTSTPRNGSFSEQPSTVLRTRSTRSKPAQDGSSDEAPLESLRQEKGNHKRLGSNSHILKQLAPYNKSPDMDRHRADDMDEDLESNTSVTKENTREDKTKGQTERKSKDRGRSVGSGRSGSPVKQTPAPRRKTSSGISPPPRSDNSHEREKQADKREGDHTEEGERAQKDAVPAASRSKTASREPEPEPKPVADAETELELDQEPEADPDPEPAPEPEPEQDREREREQEQELSQEPAIEAELKPEVEREAGNADQQKAVSLQPAQTRSRSISNKDTLDSPKRLVAEYEEEDDEEESDHDPDDPNEPKYCYCQRGSYGEMVACDNDSCPREWFHLGCTELREAPGEDEQWYCRECRPRFIKAGRSRGRGR